MKGRTGIVVLGLVAVFIAGAVFLRPTRREIPAPVAKPAEVVDTSQNPAPKPLPPPAEEAPAEPAQGLVIEVVNREGKGLRGARILQWKHAPALGTTDEAGFVTIPFAALDYEGRGASARIRFEHDDYAPRFERVPRSAKQIRITLRASAVVDLEVVNREGAPLGGAEVRVDEIEENYLSHPANPAMRAWKTDERGRVRVTGIPAGALVIRAQAKGYQENGAFVVAPEGEEPRTVRLVLKPGRRLNVIVRSMRGVPVENAKVEFSWGGGMSSSVMGGYRTYYWMRLTDKNGAVSFESLPADMAKGWLGVRSPSHPKISKLIDLNPDVTDVELTLEAGGTLSVDAVDPAGKSLSCRLVVSGPGLVSNDQENQKEKPAGEKAVFEGLPAAGPLTVSVYRNNGLIHVEPGISIVPSQTRELTIQLPAQCRVTFSARDRQDRPVSGGLDITRIKGRPGAPISGRQDDYLTYRGRIGEDGTSEMFLLVGAYTVKFWPLEGPRVEKELRVEGDMKVALEVNADASISGIIVDSADAALPNVSVQWYAEDGYWITLTGADGRFTLKRITGSSGRLSVNLSGVSIKAYAGPPPTGETRFVIPMATLRGRVVRADGAPGSALVYAASTKAESWGEDGSPPVSTNQNGSFEMRLPCGLWMITVYGEGSVPNPKPVQVDLSSPGNIVDVEFPLPPAKSP